MDTTTGEGKGNQEVTPALIYAITLICGEGAPSVAFALPATVHVLYTHCRCMSMFSSFFLCRVKWALDNMLCGRETNKGDTLVRLSLHVGVNV